MVAFNDSGQGYFTFEDFLSVPAVKKIYYFFVPSDRDKAINALFNTYKRHLSSLGSDSKLKYSMDQIRKISWNGYVFAVYYKNGDWYHYSSSGEWY